MEHTLSLIYHYLVIHRAAELALVGGSAGLSTLVQGFLHTTKIQGYLKSFLVSHVGAFAVAIATYAVSGTNYNTGTVYLLVWFLSQFWHGFVVNPIYKKYVLPFLTWLSVQKAPVTPVQAPATDIPASVELV